MPLPERFADMVVRRCIPSDFSDCEIIFSGLDSDVAGETETAFLEANFAVFSNAKNHRLAPLIPLVVPTVNLGHTQLIPAQRRHYNLTKGFLVCNSNCAVIGYCRSIRSASETRTSRSSQRRYDAGSVWCRLSRYQW